MSWFVENGKKKRNKTNKNFQTIKSFKVISLWAISQIKFIDVRFATAIAFEGLSIDLNNINQAVSSYTIRQNHAMNVQHLHYHSCMGYKCEMTVCNSKNREKSVSASRVGRTDDRSWFAKGCTSQPNAVSEKWSVSSSTAQPDPVALMSHTKLAPKLLRWKFSFSVHSTEIIMNCFSIHWFSVAP